MDLATLQKSRVTSFAEHPRLRGCMAVGILEWSPDGETLLYHLSGRYEDDSIYDGPCGTPPPAHRGFFAFTPGNRTTVPLPRLSGFHGWLPDSKGVVYERTRRVEQLDAASRSGAQGTFLSELVEQRFELGRGPAELARLAPETVHASGWNDGLGAFGQLRLHGAHALQAAVYGREGGLWEWTSVDGRERLLLQGKWAENQWPQLSPDGRWLAYAHKAGETAPGRSVFHVELRDVRLPGGGVGEPIDLGPVAHSHAWIDDDRLLVCREQGLFVVARDGAARRLGAPGACFVPRSP
jgi:hypothetical protein